MPQTAAHWISQYIVVLMAKLIAAAELLPMVVSIGLAVTPTIVDAITASGFGPRSDNGTGDGRQAGPAVNI